MAWVNCAAVVRVRAQGARAAQHALVVRTRQRRCGEGHEKNAPSRGRIWAAADKSGKPRPARAAPSASRKNVASEQSSPPLFTRATGVLSTALTVNALLVLFFANWFFIGLLLKTTGGDAGMFDAWMRWWEPIIQPSLGVFMAGAIGSALSGWIRQQWNRRGL
ncbi:hypothetical protein CDCA_CDCA13G3654 [Cyanidium caldarium]|uniref:Uncharacterized protein n=1 Tax=Cyanidium caldarium TaxID=2771 RepID=A0AAV9IZD8_CYACA|nr:hypothetical protein CDCA_CDCA13G3654 [Cyanidium caldarium]